MKNKKGLSAIVATVGLVLITFSAVALIAGFVVPYVNERIKSTECFPYRDYFYFEEDNGYNCYDKSAPEYNLYAFSVGISSTDKKEQENVRGFRVAFLKEGEAVIADVKSGDSQNFDSGGVSMLGGLSGETIVIPKVGEVKTYVYKSTKVDYNTAQIFAIIGEGKVCEVSDSIKIGSFSCASLNLEIP